MNRLASKNNRGAMRKVRVRKTLVTSPERFRLSVNISSRHAIAQIIDDTKHVTVAYATSVGAKAATGSLSEKAAWVGEQIAAQAKTKKVKRVAFDRGAHLYHGRVKALAEAARKGGLEF